MYVVIFKGGLRHCTKGKIGSLCRSNTLVSWTWPVSSRSLSSLLLGTCICLISCKKGIFYRSRPYNTRRPDSGNSLLCSMWISQVVHEHEQPNLCSREVHSPCGATLRWRSRLYFVLPTCNQMSQQIRNWAIWSLCTSSLPAQRQEIATTTNPTSKLHSVKQ